MELEPLRPTPGRDPPMTATHLWPISQFFFHETPSISTFFDETWSHKKKLVETDLYAKPRPNPSEMKADFHVFSGNAFNTVLF